MMQVQSPMPVEMSVNNEQSAYDIFKIKIALPEKRHLIWNQISY
ncbi:hypothetical protein Dpo_1c05800 [Desulfotignum phosphitoxidans DSM 13687]|uniref:Uncharacterized protein n=1 Tax=Desulfotignum phosphitoxidans DSM 13687 TaxID=1286635 RepID=S0G629_9BACT|nr:hypothetical protein Dpo_1c05800 [Desulfotignum phosphitoxidans DSM 13687]